MSDPLIGNLNKGANKHKSNNPAIKGNIPNMINIQFPNPKPKRSIPTPNPPLAHRPFGLVINLKTYFNLITSDQ